MKILKGIFQGIKWIIVTGIVLFALATFIGKNYGQTTVLILIAVLMVFWPAFIKQNLNRFTSMTLRIVTIVILFSLNFTVFKSGPKSGIYTSEENKQQMLRIYDSMCKTWPEDTKDIYIETKYGKVHLLTCGSINNPPLVMFHAASMGAHSWAENLEPFLNKYCIYSFDNIGEGNKSQLLNALIYPDSGKEIAGMYAALFDSLNIKSAHVFGASNGGYIAQVLAYYYPEKVKSLSLFGPMGLTRLTNGSIFMMSVGSMYPFKFIRKEVTQWAIGEDEYCNQKYGDWFDCIVKGTIPSIAQPVPMTTEQKKQMTMPVILFLGTKDKIVGDAGKAKIQAMDYPNIRIEILESGHLIATEHYKTINRKVLSFLNTTGK